MDEDIFTRNSIENTLDRYLKRFHIQSLQDIADNDDKSKKKSLVLICIEDFCRFKIDFDLFISLLGMIWIIDPDKFDPLKQTQVERLCFNSLELQWYIRNDPEKYIHQLTTLLEYYKKEKKA